MRTLIDLVSWNVETYGDQPALIARRGLRDDIWSHSRLWRAANSAARYLREDRGLAPSDRVIILGANSPQLVACLFAGLLARIVLVPIDVGSRREFIASVAADTGAAALITDADEQPSIAELEVIQLKSMPFDGDGLDFEESPEADDIAEIVFTSGTTGAPKGVVLTHRNILSNVQAVGEVIPPARGWRLLSLLPLSHMLEQTTGLFVALKQGATVVYPPSHSASAVADALRRYRIVGMITVPGVLTELLRRIEREAQARGRGRAWARANRLAMHAPPGTRRWLFRRVHRQLGGELRVLICGGAALPVETAKAWEQMGVAVIEGYGATECAPVIASNGFDSQVYGTVGRPLRGVDVRISEEGEIQVKGPNVSPGYWHNETATRAAFTEDEWYRTGDRGRLDPEGRILIEGRLKDRIVLSSGLNVYPEDIEAVLLEQEGVNEAIVVAIEQQPGDPKLTAVLRLGDGRDGAEVDQRVAEAAVAGANRCLAVHQRVRAVRVWEDEFPKTAVGKVKRHEILKLLRDETAEASALSAPAAGVDLASRLTAVLAEICGVEASTIQAHSALVDDLGLDSLRYVEFALLLEKQLGVSVDDGALAEMSTVGEVLALLTSEPAVPTAPPFPEWFLTPQAALVRAALQQVLVFNLHRLLARPFEVLGAEQLAQLEAPLLLVSNHTSHMDTLSILRAVPTQLRRRLSVAGAADYFYRNKLLGFMTTLFLSTFPFTRKGAVRASLERCGELADAGKSILIYPEGTRSVTGQMAPFKPGIGLLALKLDVPVVPVAVSGAYDILPKGRLIPRPGPLRVQFGEAVHLRGDAEPEDAADMLHDAVEVLLVGEGAVP